MGPDAKLCATKRRVLLLALGNSLRGDDGVAGQVLALLPIRPDVSLQALLDLTPEMASGLAGFDLVVFIDADIHAADVQVEELSVDAAGENGLRSTLTHGGTPAGIVALARQLFSFMGRALLCRIPAVDFAPGEGLSQKAKAGSVAAARRLEKILWAPCE